MATQNLSERAMQHIFDQIMREIRSGQDQVCMLVIGSKAGYSLRTTQYAIPELERRGKIIVERGKPGAPYRYRLPQ